MVFVVVRTHFPRKNTHVFIDRAAIDKPLDKSSVFPLDPADRVRIPRGAKEFFFFFFTTSMRVSLLPSSAGVFVAGSFTYFRVKFGIGPPVVSFFHTLSLLSPVAITAEFIHRIRAFPLFLL